LPEFCDFLCLLDLPFFDLGNAWLEGDQRSK
jgi:hypothetical protein